MKKILTILSIATVILAWSCTSDQVLDDGNAGRNGEEEVILRLKTPAGFSSPGGRGLTYQEESAIEEIYVLVFDANARLVAIKKGKDITATTPSDDPRYSGTSAFSVTLTSSKTTSDTYNLVVLANAGDILSETIGFDPSAISDKEYPAVTSRIWKSIDGKMYPSGGMIPMWGESGHRVIKAGTSDPMTLTRSVARIDVGVGRATIQAGDDKTAFEWDGRDAEGNPIPFVLTEVYVIRPNKSYAVIPNNTTGLPSVPTDTESFTLAESKETFAFTATQSATGGYSLRDIFVPEADVKMAGGKGDINHTNRMAIVVGGKYNGSDITTYYRLDFAVNGNLIDVLRNHLYQFNISRVSRPGHADVETAYNSLAMSTTLNVLE